MMASIDEYRDTAKHAVPAARLVATSAYAPALERFGPLAAVPIDLWELILTVAGVFLVLWQIRDLPLVHADKISLFKTVEAELAGFHPQALALLDNCKSVVNDAYERLGPAALEYDCEPNLRSADALGFWIFLNLFGRGAKGADEQALARLAGGWIGKGLGDVWQQ